MTDENHLDDNPPPPRFQSFGVSLMLAAVVAALLWVGSMLIDRRVEMSAVGLNVWSSEIKESMAQISSDPERWTSWGYLGYDSTASHSMLYLVPPTEVRVYWQAPEGDFDRTVPVENASVVGQTNDLILLYELDSRCGRARVSWKKDMEDASETSPWDRVVKRDCSIYMDKPTPIDAGPLPKR